MSVRRRTPLFPLIMPVAWLLVIFHATAAQAFTLWRPLLVLLLVVGLAYGLLRLALGDWLRAATPAGLIATFITGFWFGVLVLAVISAWWLVLTVRRRFDPRRQLPAIRFKTITGGLDTFSAIFLGVMLFNIITGGDLQLLGPNSSSLGQPPVNPPNMYVVLLDGYPSPETLTSEFNFDDSGFVGELKSLGFQVASSARSNYMKTWLTLASMFWMRYLDDIPDLEGAPETVAGQLRALSNAINTSPALEILHSHGYRIVAGTSAFTEAGLRAADVVEDSGHLNAFEDQVIRLSALGVFAPDLARALGGAETRADLRTELARLGDWAAAAHDKPTFYFDHVLSPHPPFVWKADGQPQELPPCYPATCGLYEGNYQAMGITKEQYAADLDAHVTYLNSLVVDEARRITAGDPSAVIVFFSDHGTRYDPDNHPEDFRALLAVRAPGHPEMLDDMRGPVNYLSALFNTYLGTDFPTTASRSYLSGDRPFTLIEVHYP